MLSRPRESMAKGSNGQIYCLATKHMLTKTSANLIDIGIIFYCGVFSLAYLLRLGFGLFYALASKVSRVACFGYSPKK